MGSAHEACVCLRGGRCCGYSGGAWTGRMRPSAPGPASRSPRGQWDPGGAGQARGAGGGGVGAGRTVDQEVGQHGKGHTVRADAEAPSEQAGAQGQYQPIRHGANDQVHKAHSRKRGAQAQGGGNRHAGVSFQRPGWQASGAAPTARGGRGWSKNGGKGRRERDRKPAAPSMITTLTAVPPGQAMRQAGPATCRPAPPGRR